MTLIIAVAGLEAEDLGTLEGKTYHNVHVLAVEPHSVRITHSTGVARLDYYDLAPSVRERFHLTAPEEHQKEDSRSASGQDNRSKAPPLKSSASSSAGVEEQAILQGIYALRSRDIAESTRSFQSAGVVAPTKPAYPEIATALQTLQSQLSQLRVRERQLPQVREEVDRLKHNSVITSRPNTLDPTDHSGLQRGREMLERARQLQEDQDESIRSAKEQIEQTLGTLNQLADREVKTGACSIALALIDFVKTARKPTYSNDADVASSNTQYLKLQQRVASAAMHLQASQAELQAKKLFAAKKDVEQGLEQESGNLALQRIAETIRSKIEDVAKLFAEALQLREQKHYEQAIEKIKELEVGCEDDDAAAKTLDELQSIVVDKEQRLDQARIAEKARDYESALKIYDTYSVADGIQRVIPLLGKSREDAGDFLSAYHLYERAGMSADMQRVRSLKEHQAEDYEQAKSLLAAGKFDEASAVFARYKDATGQRDVLLRKAAQFEASEKYDDALNLYLQAKAPDEITRVRTFIADRETTLQSARSSEQAANMEKALDLFTKARAISDVHRVATALAVSAEKRKEYAAAAAFFETAGEFEEAARIRKTYDVEQVSATRPLRDEEIFKRCSPACVTVVTATDDKIALGSGFFVAKGGYILTNNHVIDGAERIKIRVKGGKTVAAQVVTRKETPDLALLRASITDHPILRLTDSDRVETGAHVSAIGSPQGYEQSFTSGNISAVDREKFGNRCFQISVLINHGNSGGPLLNESGEVVGVTTFGEGTALVGDSGIHIGSDIQGINFAIKINEARSFLAAIASTE